MRVQQGRRPFAVRMAAARVAQLGVVLGLAASGAARRNANVRVEATDDLGHRSITHLRIRVGG